MATMAEGSVEVHGMATTLNASTAAARTAATTDPARPARTVTANASGT